MRQIQVPGINIPEDSPRDREIQLDLEDVLNSMARAHFFNWTAPTHDIVRRLMNEVREFKPLEGEEP